MNFGEWLYSEDVNVKLAKRTQVDGSLEKTTQ